MKLLRILFIFSVQFQAFGASRQVCQKAVQRAQPHYQKLSYYLPMGVNKQKQSFQFSKLHVRHCQSKYRDKAMPIIRHALRKHSNKIGILLPLSGPYQSLSRSFMNGLKKASDDFRIPENLFVIRSTTTDGGILRPLSQLVFQDDIGIVAGGLLENEAASLSQWGDNLERPTLILNQNSSLVENKRYALQLYPASEGLAHSLIQQSLVRGYKKVAILHPNNGKSDALISEFKKIAESSGLHLTESIAYAPGQFDSMNRAAEAIFHTHSAERPYEYKKALRNAEKAAKEAGLPFNPDKVFLPPKPLAEVIFIPDDFRIVRHFIKLFKFHGVEKFPLMGNHEWRAQGLIQPWDTFLEQSYFSDFIPRYTDLPISIPQVDPWFLHPDHVIDTDFKMLGYHFGYLIHHAFRQDTLRTTLLSRLKRVPGIFRTSGAKGYFTKRNTSSWPSWIFNLQESSLVISRPNEVKIPSLQNSRRAAPSQKVQKFSGGRG